MAQKSIANIPNQKVTWRAKMLLFLLLVQTGQFKIVCTIVFAQNSSIFHWAVHLPITFPLEVSQDGSNWSLKNYGFICNTIFFTCMYAYKSLSNKTYSLLKIAELEIWLCAWRQGECFISIVDLVFEQSLVNDSSANTACIYVVIADQQKARKQGRDDSIKQFGIQPHLHNYLYWPKDM